MGSLAWFRGKTCPRRAFSIVGKSNIPKVIMIKTALLLFLLELAAADNVPIQKEIVGPGGENIKVNVQVGIETSGIDTPGEEVDNITHPPPNPKCANLGRLCSVFNPCCPGLRCKFSGSFGTCRRARESIKPECPKAGEPCSIGKPQCCPGLRCEFAGFGTCRPPAPI